MTNSEQYSLPFLGSRHYLHGTTLFELFSEKFPDAEEVTFKIKNMILSNQILLTAAPESAAESSATFTYIQNGELKKVNVVPLETVLPITKVDYDEDKIITTAVFKEKQAVIDQPIPTTFIKAIVAMNKELLHRHILNDKTQAQILFTRIDLNFLPQTFSSLQIHLKNKNDNTASTSSRIFIDTTYAGDLYFSWKQN